MDGDPDLVTVYDYDDHGMLTSITDPRNVVTTYEYDDRNRLVQRIVDPGGGEHLNLTTLWEWYPNDRVKKITDPRGYDTEFFYNEQDFLVRVKDAEDFWTVYTRDAHGAATKVERTIDANPSAPAGPYFTVSYTYDEIDRLLTRTVDPGSPPHLALTTTYTYSPTTGCACSGATPGAGRPNKIEDAEGKLSYFKYDELDRRTKIVRKVNDTSATPDGDDAVTTITYDPEGNVTQVVGPEGETVTYVYDEADRRIETRCVSVAGDLVYAYEYDDADNLTKITRPDGMEVRLDYDLANRMIRAADDVGGSDKTIVALGYDENGNVLTRSTELTDHVWTYEYDAADRLKKVFDPIHEDGTDLFAEYDYDGNGNRTLFTDNLGIKTQYVFDHLDRLTAMIENFDGSGPTADTQTSYGYNGLRQVTIADHNDATTTYEYDDALRLTKITYPDSAGGADVVAYDYDGVGNLTERTDQRGIVTTYVYNDLHQLETRSYSGGGRDETFTWDRSGRLLAAVTDDSAVPDVSFHYDDLGRLDAAAQTFDPGELSEIEYALSYAYNVDADPRTLERVTTYPSTRAVTDVLDGRSRLAAVAGGLHVGVEWTFDDGGRRETAARGNGILSKLTYDLNDRLMRVQHARDVSPAAFVFDVEFGYDAVGNRTWQRDHVRDDHSAAYDYDPRHRLTKVLRGEMETEPDTGIDTTLSDTEIPHRQEWTTLDRNGNWLGFESENATAEIVQARTLAQSASTSANEYLRTNATVGTAPGKQHFTYDAAGNLTRTDLVGDLNCDGEVDFDDFDPFVLALSDPEAYAEQYPDCPMVLGDVNGDTYVNFDDITDFAALLSGTQMAAQKYLYDEENRLIAVTTTDDEPLLEIRYDAVGRRVLTIDYVGAGEVCISDLPRWTRHVYSGIQVVAEYEACGWDAGQPETGWELAREFVWGDRFPEPLALIDYTDAGDVAAPDPEILHYLHDPLGNVVGLTDLGDPEASPDPIPGRLVERYVYDAYGKTYVEVWNAGMSQWDRVEGSASKYGNPFMWTGQRYDPGVKLYHFLFRSYSPALGRWMQRDPLQYINGPNLYQYVISNPNGWIDPLGLSFKSWLKSTVVGTVTGAISGAVSGAITGAIAGVIVGGPAGALAGAAAGAAAGAVCGGIAGGVAAAASDGISQMQGGPGLSGGQAATTGAVSGAISGGVCGLVSGITAAQAAAAAGKGGATGVASAPPPPAGTNNQPSGSGTWGPEKAPRNTAPTGCPDTRDWNRLNPKTGEVEESTVTSDELGRQIGRTDYTDHGWPDDHDSPHHHRTIWGPERREGEEQGPFPGPFPGHPPTPPSRR